MKSLSGNSEIRTQGRSDGEPPSGDYQPPGAESVALAFADATYAAPNSSTIPLSFGPPPASAPGPYAPPDASDLPLTFTGGAFNPPQPDTLTREF